MYATNSTPGAAVIHDSIACQLRRSMCQQHEDVTDDSARTSQRGRSTAVAAAAIDVTCCGSSFSNELMITWPAGPTSWPASGANLASCTAIWSGSGALDMSTSGVGGAATSTTCSPAGGSSSGSPSLLTPQSSSGAACGHSMRALS
eukprot:2180039-Pyramimonas_sp.AAC.2